MASQGIIFVNYNYRVSSLGYLATPELSAEFEQVTGSNSSGNWGMVDQFAALKWVHANIAAFGGDPDRITAMGQSAGSAAVYHVVNSDLTKGLLSGAIAESGLRSPYDPEAATLAENYRTLDTALAISESFMASKNVSTIAEMRELSMDDLTADLFGSAYNFGNVLNYYCMPDTYLNTLKNDPANDVPFMTGKTKDKSGAATLTNLTVAEYIAEMTSQYGNGTLAAKFLELYPSSNSTQVTAKSPIYTCF